MKPSDTPKASLQIDLIAMDVDGVLTDGGIIFDNNGNETKRFNVHDGFAIKLAQQMGFTIAIITGRNSPVVTHRARDLSIQLVYQGSKDKLADLHHACAQAGTTPEKAAFIGDDWPDLTAMRAAGLSIAPANAAAEIKSIARHTTQAHGGHGAVRQAIEYILKATGRYNAALHHYDPTHPISDGQTTRPTF